MGETITEQLSSMNDARCANRLIVFSLLIVSLWLSLGLSLAARLSQPGRDNALMTARSSQPERAKAVKVARLWALGGLKQAIRGGQARLKCSTWGARRTRASGPRRPSLPEAAGSSHPGRPGSTWQGGPSKLGRSRWTTSL